MEEAGKPVPVGTALTDLESKLAKRAAKGLQVRVDRCHTVVLVVAIAHDHDKNFVKRINCKNGVPISGYIYDTQSDSYFYECADFLPLGTVPISFRLSVDGDPDFDMVVPIPEKLLKTFFSDGQKKIVASFRKHFSSKDYRVAFVQQLEPN